MEGEIQTTGPNIINISTAHRPLTPTEINQQKNIEAEMILHFIDQQKHNPQERGYYKPIKPSCTKRWYTWEELKNYNDLETELKIKLEITAAAYQRTAKYPFTIIAKKNGYTFLTSFDTRQEELMRQKPTAQKDLLVVSKYEHTEIKSEWVVRIKTHKDPNCPFINTLTKNKPQNILVVPLVHVEWFNKENNPTPEEVRQILKQHGYHKNQTAGTGIQEYVTIDTTGFIIIKTKAQILQERKQETPRKPIPGNKLDKNIKEQRAKGKKHQSQRQYQKESGIKPNARRRLDYGGKPTPNKARNLINQIRNRITTRRETRQTKKSNEEYTRMTEAMRNTKLTTKDPEKIRRLTKIIQKLQISNDRETVKQSHKNTENIKQEQKENKIKRCRIFLTRIIKDENGIWIVKDDEQRRKPKGKRTEARVLITDKADTDKNKKLKDLKAKLLGDETQEYINNCHNRKWDNSIRQKYEATKRGTIQNKTKQKLLTKQEIKQEPMDQN